MVEVAGSNPAGPIIGAIFELAMENITRRDCIKKIGLIGAALALSSVAIAKESDLEIIENFAK